MSDGLRIIFYGKWSTTDNTLALHEMLPPIPGEGGPRERKSQHQRVLPWRRVVWPLCAYLYPILSALFVSLSYPIPLGLPGNQLPDPRVVPGTSLLVIYFSGPLGRVAHSSQSLGSTQGNSLAHSSFTGSTL